MENCKQNIYLFTSFAYRKEIFICLSDLVSAPKITISSTIWRMQLRSIIKYGMIDWLFNLFNLNLTVFRMYALNGEMYKI